MSVDQSWLDRYRDEYLQKFGANAGAPSAGSVPVPGVSPEQVHQPPQGYQYVPNYMQILQSMPEYLDWQNSGTFDVNSAAAARAAGLKALVMRYGGMGGLRDTYGDIDQATLDLAEANPYSDTKRITRGYEQGVEQYKKNLAGRRMLRSGSLQYGLDQADYGRGASEYDLANEYGNAVQRAINDYLGVENQFKRSQSDAIRSAVSAGAPIYEPTPTPPPPSGSTTPPATSTTEPTTGASTATTQDYDPFLKRYTQDFF